MDLKEDGESLPPRVIITFKRYHVAEPDESSSEDLEDPLPCLSVQKAGSLQPGESRSADGNWFMEHVPRKPESSLSGGFSDGDTTSVQPLMAEVVKPDLLCGVKRGCQDSEDTQKVHARWCPDGGRKPCLPDAPTFYPSAEEFKDTLTYIASIRAHAELFGICRVIPPESWRPPCPLQEKDPDTLQFATRVQQIHKLQKRGPSLKVLPLKQNLTGVGKKKRKAHYSLEKKPAVSVMDRFLLPHPSATPAEQPEDFGFEPGKPSSLTDFQEHANFFKEEYFQRTEASADCQSSNTGKQKWEPSVDIVEGEYWRIVEQPTTEVEVLYGADVQTGTFGSGFPKEGPGVEGDDRYTNSGWNLNKIGRIAGSMLGSEEGDIQGVLVPWLYIGMCFSSFCWHVEDHHFYSINCVHWGAPKVWYGVPSYAAQKLVTAMKKHLPDLFTEQPDLLQKLVTQLSPSILREEGVPVYRLVQQPGDFVVTFPRAYHSGFNCGFNVAEAVNMAPVDWLPHGQSAAELYREQCRKTTISHDKLLLGAARQVAKMFWLSFQNIPQEGVMNAKWKVEFEGPDGQIKSLDPCWVSAWAALCGQGGILAKALKVRVEMEEARRIAIQQVDSINVMKMDGSHDTTEEQECEICKYDLHLSAVSCESHPGRFSCLLHSTLLCSCPLSKRTVLYRYDLDELKLLLAAISLREGAMNKWAEQECFGLSSSRILSASHVLVRELLLNSTDQYENERVVENKRSVSPRDHISRVASGSVGKDVSASVDTLGIFVARNSHMRSAAHVVKRAASLVADSCTTNLALFAGTSAPLSSDGNHTGPAQLHSHDRQIGALNLSSSLTTVVSLQMNAKEENMHGMVLTTSEGLQYQSTEEPSSKCRTPAVIRSSEEPLSADSCTINLALSAGIAALLSSEVNHAGAAQLPSHDRQIEMSNSSSSLANVGSLQMNAKEVNMQRMMFTTSGGLQNQSTEEFSSKSRTLAADRSSAEAPSTVSCRQPFSIRNVGLQFANGVEGAPVHNFLHPKGARLFMSK